MRQYLLDLYEIQKIDLNIRDQEKRQEALPARLNQLETRVEELAGKLTSLTDQRSAAAKEAQNLRTLVDDETQKIRKWDARLADIRNQREYQALSREIEGSKRANRDSEEKITQALATRDTLDKQIEELKGQLSEAEAARNSERDAVGGQVDGMKATLAEEVKRRDALIPRVPKALFRKYDTIRARRMGVGLSAVVAGCCQGCNMRLPPQLYNILQRGDTIEQCPSCFRVIYWDQILPEGERAQSANASQ